MLAIDLIGFIITILAIGIRYPHYVVLVALVHEIGQLCTAFILDIQVDLIIAAGVFSTTDVTSNSNNGVINALAVLSGSLANYIFCATAGGIDQERAMDIVNPSAKLINPFAVINLRLAIVSVLTSIWQFL